MNLQNIPEQTEYVVKKALGNKQIRLKGFDQTLFNLYKVEMKWLIHNM